MKTDLLLQIRKRSGLVYRGYVKTITSQNEKGVFDVLPAHTNFITLIESFVQITLSSGEKKEFNIDTALMKVENNQVEIFQDITSFGENLESIKV